MALPLSVAGRRLDRDAVGLLCRRRGHVVGPWGVVEGLRGRAAVCRRTVQGFTPAAAVDVLLRLPRQRLRQF